MSIEISGNYKNDYLEKVWVDRDKAKEVLKDQNAENKNEGIPIPKDEYISSEKFGGKPSGLYHLGQDESGNPKVLYDAPKKATAPQKDEPAKKAEEKCTTNTDNVDREIEKLKEEKKQLKQQIQAAAGEEEKIKELEKKLTQIEGELSQKDNDTYRRQNAVIS